jgi:NAD(P)-dependent dehydrogenase (short-subunit alcohol dehydrogenase family)
MIDKSFLKNKNILITGPTKGIGKSLTYALSEFGANIIMLGRNEKKLELIYDEIKKNYNCNPLIVVCDLEKLNESSSREIFESLSVEIKNLDYLIINAAIIGKMSKIIDYDYSTWKKVINTNLNSSFLLTKHMQPLLEGSNDPRIIYTTSGVASEAEAYWGAYAVSKAGMEIMAKIFADEMENISKIKVFNFNPGPTNTSMRSSAFPAEDKTFLNKPKDLINYYIWLLQCDTSKKIDREKIFSSKNIKL